MLDSQTFRNLKSSVQNRDLRVLLWDIDGTLMRSTAPGAWREYFAPALEKVYGSSGKLAEVQVSGMTDTQIAYESLKDEGFTPERILGAKENLLKIFKEEMSRVLSENKGAHELLPGAREILEAVSQRQEFVCALLTGNLSVAAEIKLRSFDLWKYFENAPNIFGEISHDRRLLAKAAVEKISEHLGVKLKPEQFIVIGDTPNDIACARSIGAKMVSVATGRNNLKEKLAEFKPDVLIDNLAETERILRIFENL